MQFEGLRDVRFVRTSSFVYIIMSCAPYILRSAFRLIRSREIFFFSRPSLTKIIGCSSLKFIDDMHLVGLRAISLVRMPFFVC